MLVRRGKLVCTHTEADVLEDFRRLRDTPADDLVDDVAWTTRNEGCPAPKRLHLYRTLRTGQMLSEYFHWKHRVRTSTAHKPSGQDVLDQWTRDPKTLDNMHKHTLRATPHTTDEYQRYRTVFLNSALYTLSHWRASVSKHLADTVHAERVLDFSAGWGDRLTGFLASESVREITLVDPRPGSIRACRKQHALVRRLLSSPKTLHTHQAGAEKVLPALPGSHYDLIVTSPPYLDLERYGETAAERVGQIWQRATTHDAFVSLFLEPVLRHCARILAPSGVLALNVDDNPRKGIVLCQPVLDLMKKHTKLVFVGTAGLRKGKGYDNMHGQSQVRAEPIYIFVRK